MLLSGDGGMFESMALVGGGLLVQGVFSTLVIALLVFTYRFGKRVIKAFDRRKIS